MNKIIKTAAAIATLIAATTIPASANQFFLFGPVQTTPAPIQQSAPTEERAEVPARFRRQIVNYQTPEKRGTIIVDTRTRFLYYVLGNGKAVRYGIGVGRDGFTWSGVQTITRRAEWPDWHPPAEMIARQPYLPRYMAGGPGNPMGARALYLGSTVFRIHGTNQPETIGEAISSGCFRLANGDIVDLYERVPLGTKVIIRHKATL